MLISLLRLIRNFAALNNHPTRKGQRVRLMDKSRKASPENPIAETSYECEGTVCGFDRVGTFRIGLFIEWDNGQKNSYDQNDLVVSDLPCNPYPYHFKPNFTKNNPNYTFKERKASLRYHEASGPRLKARGGTWL